MVVNVLQVQLKLANERMIFQQKRKIYRGKTALLDKVKTAAENKKHTTACPILKITQPID